MKGRILYIVILLLFAACSSDAASPVKPTQPETQTPKSSASKTPDAVPASSSAQMEAPVKLKIHVNDTTFTATLEENSSAKAFAEFLAQGDMTLDMHDYGSFEKVADLPRSFPRNDKQIDTDAGDIILYQGNSITIYYDKNSWNFTRLARIDNVNKKSWVTVILDGTVSLTEIKKLLDKSYTLA